MSMGIDFDFTEKFICLQSTISAGFTFPNVDIEPIYLDIDVDNEILGQKIKEALSKSVDILDGNERHLISKKFFSPEHIEKITQIRKDRAKALKKRYGYRKLKDLERDYKTVFISLSEEGDYEMNPSLTKRGGATGFDAGHEIIIPKDNSDEQIGAAARHVMSLCKSVYK